MSEVHSADLAATLQVIIERKATFSRNVGEGLRNSFCGSLSVFGMPVDKGILKVEAAWQELVPVPHLR